MSGAFIVIKVAKYCFNFSSLAKNKFSYDMFSSIYQNKSIAIFCCGEKLCSCKRNIH